MNRRIVLFPACVAVLLAGQGTATSGPEPNTCATTPGPAGIATSVLDGATLVLDSGVTVRLAGIDVPRRQPGKAAPAEAETARQDLERLVAGKTLVLRFPGAERDRHDRAVAFVVTADGVSLGDVLIRRGLARVLAGALPEGCMRPLLVLERAARTADSGLWKGRAFAVRRANDPSLATQKGLYVLVEGRVATVGRGTRMVFLNFGRDWRRDFTAMVATDVAARVAGEGKPVSGLAGKRVLVRGLIEDQDGALIRVTGAGGLEVLDD
jgi:endonuclease YncB( thermonuclease family)